MFSDRRSVRSESDIQADLPEAVYRQVCWSPVTQGRHRPHFWNAKLANGTSRNIAWLGVRPVNPSLCHRRLAPSRCPESGRLRASRCPRPPIAATSRQSRTARSFPLALRRGSPVYRSLSSDTLRSATLIFFAVSISQFAESVYRIPAKSEAISTPRSQITDTRRRPRSPIK